MFGVAHDAKFRLGVIIGKVFLIRTMRPVTTHAIQGNIIISRIDDLFSDRMTGMPLPNVTFTADSNDRRIVE